MFINQISSLKSLDISPDGITDLISLQSNLKSLALEYCNKDIIRIITPSLIKSSLTITKLVFIDTANSPLSFISTFINLQELILHLDPDDPNAEGAFEGFGQLQYIKFPTIENFITKFSKS
ncbi:uncharacterized protein OCT59_003914 [Rhizophagus irregularis]|uniref:uncharacterized protein n=1 Tax=Rhizophagus irregularis TaxID=588596 RepID=UPI003332C8E6|nr:hypothetical protein OCT59_003914 [Rhizophagus irregularis]